MVVARQKGEELANNFFTMKVEPEWKKRFKAFADSEKAAGKQDDDMTSIAKRGIELIMSGATTGHAPEPTPDTALRIELEDGELEKLDALAKGLTYPSAAYLLELLARKSLEKPPREVHDYLTRDFLGSFIEEHKDELQKIIEEVKGSRDAKKTRKAA